jgi:hypothetical protein
MSTNLNQRQRTATETRNRQRQDAPPPRPVNLDHRIESAFPARYLRAWHLLNNGLTEITDTIKELMFEPVTQDGLTYEEVLAIYFTRIKTPFLLSAKVHAATLRQSYHCKTFADLIGLEITLMVGDYNGREVLRIKPLPKGATPKRSKSAAKPEENLKEPTTPPPSAAAETEETLSEEELDHLFASGEAPLPTFQVDLPEAALNGAAAPA